MMNICETSEGKLGSRARFVGDLCEMSALDLFQTAHMNRKTGRLRVNSDLGIGEIGFASGEPTHARMGDIFGDAGVYRILAATRGRFELVLGECEDDEEGGGGEGDEERWLLAKVDGSAQALMMDAMRIIDDTKVAMNDLPNVESVLIVTEALDANELQLARIHTSLVLEMIGERGRSIAELRAEARLGDSELFACLRDLLEAGKVADTGLTSSAAPSFGTLDDPAVTSWTQSKPERRTSSRGIAVAAAISTVCLFAGPLLWLQLRGEVHWWSDSSRGSTTARQVDFGVHASAAARLRRELPVSRATRSCPRGMAWIDAGVYFRGSQSEGAGLAVARPVHKVRVGGFCMDVHEVTSSQFRECSSAGECERAHRKSWWSRKGDDRQAWHDRREILSHLCNENEEKRADHPANCVTWYQARQYCRWQGKRLPTEAEWEYAARGPDGRVYPWGDAPPTSRHLNACGAECRLRRFSSGLRGKGILFEASDGHSATAPVGSYPDGQTPFGLMDMTGNVSEWTADYLASYRDTADPLVDPKGPSRGKSRVIRGGAFNSFEPSFVDPAMRVGAFARTHSHAIGFRCAADPSGVRPGVDD